MLAGEVVGNDAAGVTVRLDGVEADPFTIPLTGVAAAPGAKVTVGIRPEHFTVEGSARLRLETDVVEHLGGESYIYAHNRTGQRVIIKTTGVRDQRSGQPVAPAFHPASALLFDTDGLRLRGTAVSAQPSLAAN